MTSTITKPAADTCTGDDLPDGSYFLTVGQAGKTDGMSHFAIIGREIVEAVDETPDGRIDWTNAGICDPVTGDAGFFYPAMALLTFFNTEWVGVTGWHSVDQERVGKALDQFGGFDLVLGYVFDTERDGFRVNLHGGERHYLQTPAEADAFCAALRSAVAAVPVAK